MKQIKLAEIQKKKATDAQRARELVALQGDEPEETLITKNEALEKCIDKVGLMSKLIYKLSYSRPFTYRRHLICQHKLHEFLGQNLFDDEDDKSDSMRSDLVRIEKMANNRVTYAELLQRIESAERNFNETRNRVTGKSKPVDSMSYTGSHNT